MESFMEKIMEFFSKADPLENPEILDFIQAVSSDNDTERILTCFPTEEGMIVFCAFGPEQWSMVNDIATISQKEIPDIVVEMAENNEIPTLCIDPTQFD
jgi:hypothetical protein